MRSAEYEPIGRSGGLKSLAEGDIFSRGDDISVHAALVRNVPQDHGTAEADSVSALRSDRGVFVIARDRNVSVV